MYRFHVAIADLVPPPSGERDGLPRLPVLERLLATADRAAAEGDWRRWALQRLGCALPAGRPALARRLAEQHGGAVEGVTWFVLTPLHLVAGLTTVHHHAAGPGAWTSSVAERLVGDLARDFADADLCFRQVGDQVLLGISGLGEVQTQDPALLAGRELSSGVAQGADARRLARLCSEFELWLHGRGICARDGRLVHALHPWGEGEVPIRPARRSPRLLTDDPFLQSARGDETDAEAALGVWSVAELLGQGRGFADADALWAQPLGARLRDGEIAEAHLYAAGSVWRLRAAQRWRFWRPIKPWWEQLT
jgi:hypothetical protein